MTKETKIYNEEKIVSSISCARKIGQLQCKRMKLEHSLTPYTKVKSKWIKHLNVRSDTKTLLEENIGRTYFEVNHSNISLDPFPRVMKIKTKFFFKLDLIKLQTFCTVKETISKMKRQPTEWEKLSSNKVTNKELISKLHK